MNQPILFDPQPTHSRWSRRQFLATVAAAGAFGIGATGASRPAATKVFSERGYYLLPCRTPTLGYDAYRDLVDDLAKERVNTLILWLGGGFRSRKFPITWQYNAEHLNVRHDFMGRLIRHAHRRGIKCLLGFTPFGYDGVNQYPRELPELKAMGADAKPVAEFGIHCWGWNLCPAKPESQRFMLEYVRELASEFYPGADGLFIESSDYAICHWLAEGTSPYRELPVRAARIAYREYTADPDLSNDALHAVLGLELFGGRWQPAQVLDLLELCRVFGTDRDWSVPAPLTTPGLVESRRKSGRLDSKKRAFLRDQLARVCDIAARNRHATTPGGRELARIAQWLDEQWQGANGALLEG